MTPPLSSSVPYLASPPRRRLLMSLALGCALPRRAHAAEGPTAPFPPLPGFTQTRHANAPLAGRILGAGGATLDPAQLVDRCAAASLCMLGEQHDHPDHHALQAWLIEALAARGRLAAVALEMADAGTRFDGPRDAAEAAVRDALRWNAQGWPWAMYAPPVMAAVRAGATVAGVNLPDAAMKTAYADPRWDASVPPAVRERIVQEVADSHCGLLPEAQVPNMARVQFARDDNMAAHALALARPGQTVALLTGSVHADRSLGIALHLAAHAAPAGVDRPVQVFSLLLRGLAADTPATVPRGYDAVWFTPATPPVDHCAQFKRQLKRRADGGRPAN